MARLIFLDETFAGRVYELAVEKTTVGRGNQNTLTIHDSSVSDTHCEILLAGLEVIVRDLGSRNGTVVNGRRLCRQQCELLDGQVVKFGAVQARLELPPPSTSDTMSDVTAVHAHVDSLREQQSKPTIPEKISAVLAGDDDSAPAEHTMILPRSASEPTTDAPRTGHDANPGKTPLRAWIIASVLIAVAVVCWILWRRS